MKDLRTSMVPIARIRVGLGRSNIRALTCRLHGMKIVLPGLAPKRHGIGATGTGTGTAGVGCGPRVVGIADLGSITGETGTARCVVPVVFGYGPYREG
jgi:hypothetical protein